MYLLPGVLFGLDYRHPVIGYIKPGTDEIS